MVEGMAMGAPERGERGRAAGCILPTGTVELLAPARDLECGRTAIDCGADAVYIGAPRFGARAAAGNSLDDIAALVRHAHAYWARVYVTLNTLLRDDELPEAVQLVERLYEAGIDGLIIQDAGLLECDLPPLPLIASTQMHNHTAERVAFLEQAGIQRAILARELTLDEIREIRRATRIELECFVHGALCVGYSGQCYLSYALGGRSGNRGECAQPCRKPYTLVDATGRELARGKHLLSLRDLNLSDHLRELLAAGVTSLKIEGRLKERAYVANVVAHYRARLDEALAETGLRRGSSGTARPGFEPDVTKTFNRGYTTHFLHGRREPVGAVDTPKMVGEPAGSVVAVTPRGVLVDAAVDLHPGDGLSFFDAAGELRGTLVNGVRPAVGGPQSTVRSPESSVAGHQSSVAGRQSSVVGDQSPVSRPPSAAAGHPSSVLLALGTRQGLARGTVLYRNRDHEFLSRVEHARPERRIAVALTLREAPGGLSLRAVDEDGCEAELTLPCEVEPARKPEQALEGIRKQLAKTGETLFECREVSIDLPEPLFVPTAILNALRRVALERLAAERERLRPKARGGARRNDAPYPTTTLTFEGNVLNRCAEAFYLRHGVISIEPAAESGLDLRGRRVMTTRHCIQYQLGLCTRQAPADRPALPLALIDAEGRRLELHFDCSRCEMSVTVGRSAPRRGSDSPPA